MSLFVTIEDEAVDALLARELFTGVTANGETWAGILTERRLDIDNEVERAVTKMSGLLITVVIGGGSIEFPDIPGPLIKADLTVNVVELVTLNQSDTGTGISAKDAVEEVLKTLHQFEVPNTGGLQIVAESPAFELQADADALRYTLNFTVAVPLDADVPVEP